MLLPTILLFSLPILVASLQFNLADVSSIKSASSTIVKNLLTFYPYQQKGFTPGVLPKPYYWWQAGALWGELIEYWAYTGDATWNQLVTDAITFQIGPSKSFMPENVTNQEGNDDQAFWAFTALTAAELKFPDPPANKSPGWLALAQAVFSNQVGRWDTSTCGGGLRWQIFIINAGYDYKNTISNGAFFQLAARLARYTGMSPFTSSVPTDKIGNSTYSDWADKMWDWMASTPNLTPDFQVNDGSAIRYNCTDANHDQWTYNYGTMIMGSAFMYSISTGADAQKWQTRVDGLVDTLFRNFFPTNINGQPTSPNVMVEIQCEIKKVCNTDQTSFKAYTVRWLAMTTQLCPWTKDKIMPKIQGSGAGAAAQCSGGDDGTWCGQNWNSATWDGMRGAGEQMSALAAISANLISGMPKPVTAQSGGISQGDPNAGSIPPTVAPLSKLTVADTVGASILTALAGIAMIAMAWWLMKEET